MMPNMNGWEFCVELNRDPKLGGIPVVVMTAASTIHRKEELAAAAYLQKPFPLAALFETLNQLLSNHRSLRRD
jgi:CheY-like chemotaxis protein